MTAQELREKYLNFFKSKGHTIIPSASLIPRETDASTLFTTAGMHPLVPYLLGEKHPGGTRVANVQKCVRTGDIDDVGDNRHLTFFEMMGNWSFGDYFKEDAIEWSFEFLTDEKWLGLDKNRLYVTVFKGEDGIPRDEDSINIWKKVFADAGMDVAVAGDDEIVKDNIRIIPLGKDDNFWIAGVAGPCGGDTEMFYDMHPEEGKLEGKFGELVDSFRIMEVWNNVFMEFNKQEKKDKIEEIRKLQLEGKPIPEEYYEYIKLKNPNVDTGMGVERTLTVLDGQYTVFETELFEPIFDKLEEISQKPYGDKIIETISANGALERHGNLYPTKDGALNADDIDKSFRVIADHIKAATFMIADGVEPSNAQRGYVLRRIIRRAIIHGKSLGIDDDFTGQIADIVIKMYGDFYLELEKGRDKILGVLKKEENKFLETLEKGLKEFNKTINEIWSPSTLPWNKEHPFMLEGKILPGSVIFKLVTSYGFPKEIILEEAKRRNIIVPDHSLEEFEKLFNEHKELSRTASAGMFKGGLQDSSEDTAKLHTATHLLLAGLRQVLGKEVFQRGSNITPERLRFDFSYGEKMTSAQIMEVEAFVNACIRANLEVVREEMSLDEAMKSNAMGVFGSKYGDMVTVYSIVNDQGKMVSREICGGPHVKKTLDMGHFRIQKEEASSAGVRRIKAVLE